MPRVTDVTNDELAHASGPGDRVKRVHDTKPAKALTPALEKYLATWRARGSDRSIGYTSNVMAYGVSRAAGGRSSDHTNMLRLLKGGHMRLCRVDAPPPPGSHAYRDSPYGNRYYFLREGSCPTDVSEGTLAGAKRHRRR